VHSLENYKTALDKAVAELPLNRQPENLYEPITYILGLGGKKIRPLLSLMACDLYSGSFMEAIPQALAVEIFHNFTLLHDDIMDKAHIRRGKPTVHIKWNEPTAILSGDLMLILAYEQVVHAPHHLQLPFFHLMSTTAREICEGQQFDMDFETKDQVSLDEYVEMIRLKTAVLLGCSLQLGALRGGANEIDARLLYKFGEQLGIAFQITDDLLDSFGDEASFGKKIGGDILANKKTFLRIKAIEFGNAKQVAQLKELDSEQNVENKIATVKQIFTATGVVDEAQKAIKHYHDNALKCASELNLSEKEQFILSSFANELLNRQV
jgi:geranylgeranyl diphosphate synthase type II